MYSLNTQLAYFNNDAVLKKLVVNITWLKLMSLNSRTIKLQAFSKMELDQLLVFIDQNRLNFPGNYFIEEKKEEITESVLRKETAKHILPHYFILSTNQNIQSAGPFYKKMKINLTNDTYTEAIDYLLSFAVAGKIEIYREAK